MADQLTIVINAQDKASPALKQVGAIARAEVKAIGTAAQQAGTETAAGLGKIDGAARQATSGISGTASAAKGASGGLKGLGGAAAESTGKLGTLSAALRAQVAEMGGLSAAVKTHAEDIRAAGMVLVGVGAAGAMAIKGMLGAAGEKERFSAQLKVLTGSAEEAQKRLEQLTAFAAKTPFDLPGVIQADMLLQSFRMDLGGVEKTLQVVGDTAAGTGAPLANVIAVLAKLKAGSYDMLEVATNLHLTRDDFKELGIQFNETSGQMESSGEEAFAAAVKLLSRFSGLMEEQSKTLEGKLSNLRDSFWQLGAAAGEGLLPMAKTLTSGLTALNAVAKTLAGNPVGHFFTVVASAGALAVGTLGAIGIAAPGVIRGWSTISAAVNWTSGALGRSGPVAATAASEILAASEVAAASAPNWAAAGAAAQTAATTAEAAAARIGAASAGAGAAGAAGAGAASAAGTAAGAGAAVAGRGILARAGGAVAGAARRFFWPAAIAYGAYSVLKGRWQGQIARDEAKAIEYEQPAPGAAEWWAGKQAERMGAAGGSAIGGAGPSLPLEGAGSATAGASAGSLDNVFPGPVPDYGKMSSEQQQAWDQMSENQRFTLQTRMTPEVAGYWQERNAARQRFRSGDVPPWDQMTPVEREVWMKDFTPEERARLKSVRSWRAAEGAGIVGTGVAENWAYESALDLEGAGTARGSAAQEAELMAASAWEPISPNLSTPAQGTDSSEFAAGRARYYGGSAGMSAEQLGVLPVFSPANQARLREGLTPEPEDVSEYELQRDWRSMSDEDRSSLWNRMHPEWQGWVGAGSLAASGLASESVSEEFAAGRERYYGGSARGAAAEPETAPHELVVRAPTTLHGEPRRPRDFFSGQRPAGREWRRMQAGDQGGIEEFRIVRNANGEREIQFRIRLTEEAPPIGPWEDNASRYLDDIAFAGGGVY